MTIQMLFRGFGCFVAAVGFILVIMGSSDKKMKMLIPPGIGILVAGTGCAAIFHMAMSH